MAGGKISPRQKMINMMYLVLTALLALNVSKEILRSFDLIAASLHTSAEKLYEKNNNLGGDIKTSVEKEKATGNNKNANLPALVDEVTLNTNEVVKFIEAQITAMESDAIGGKDPVTNKVKAPDNIEKAYRYWMLGPNGEGRETDNGGRGNGKAKELREKLQKYVDWANKWYTANNIVNGKPTPFQSGNKETQGFRHIAIDPKEDPTVDPKDEAKQKPWEYFIFHGTPVIANIAMLQKFKNDVRVIEAENLALLRGKLNEVTFKIDSLVAMDAPVSQVVAAGLPFETKLFVTASSKQAQPQFAGTGAITVSPDRQSATLKIMANGGVIPKGQNVGKQTYSATIKVPKADGSLQTLTINKTFEVRKPEIVITSASIQNMYQNCGNEINIDVPALGTSYNPVIAVSDGAKAIQSKQSIRKWTIIPPGRKVTLNVRSNTNGQLVQVGNVDYTVIPPPKPRIALGVDNRDWDGIVPIRMGARVEVRCYPDANFKNQLPRDARYQMRNVVLKAGSGLAAPSPVGAAQNSVMAPQGYATVTFSVPRDLSPGSKVYFVIDDIFRINYEDKPIKEPFSDRELSQTAVVR